MQSENLETVNTPRSKLVLTFPALFALALILDAGARAQDFKETLLSTDNAYNPIPSPDGKYIAYVRTGWGTHLTIGWTSSFGRSNLVSEVIAIDQNSVRTTSMPLADMFLEGRTPDSRQLVCFRDWGYALVSIDGKRVMEGRIPNDPDKPPATERVSYSPSLREVLWNRLIDSSLGTIETPSRTVVREEVFRGQRVVPSPDGRYLAALGESLRIYDLRLGSWTDLGKFTIHPDANWSYIQPHWSPWFSDGSRLVFLRNSMLVIASPGGTIKTEIKIQGLAGLPVPSPDGQSIAYVTFDPQPMKGRPDLLFWGGTTIFVIPSSGGATARQVTKKNQDEVFDLKWLGNDILAFDRIADEDFYKHSRVWKAAVPR
jgi:hypothetical protein